MEQVKTIGATPKRITDLNFHHLVLVFEGNIRGTTSDTEKDGDLTFNVEPGGIKPNDNWDLLNTKNGNHGLHYKSSSGIPLIITSTVILMTIFAMELIQEHIFLLLKQMAMYVLLVNGFRI
jgi:hypothetical protein